MDDAALVVNEVQASAAMFLLLSRVEMARKSLVCYQPLNFGNMSETLQDDALQTADYSLPVEAVMYELSEPIGSCSKNKGYSCHIKSYAPQMRSDIL